MLLTYLELNDAAAFPNTTNSTPHPLIIPAIVSLTTGGCLNPKVRMTLELWGALAHQLERVAATIHGMLTSA